MLRRSKRASASVGSADGGVGRSFSSVSRARFRESLDGVERVRFGGVMACSGSANVTVFFFRVGVATTSTGLGSGSRRSFLDAESLVEGASCPLSSAFLFLDVRTISIEEVGPDVRDADLASRSLPVI